MAGETGELNVRRMTSFEELGYGIKLAIKEGLQPGVGDAECYFATDPMGFFVAELGEQKIGTVSFVKYDNKLAFAGFFILENQFKGKGYGGKLFKTARGLASVDGYNIGIDAVPRTTGLYEKYGFKKAWTDTRYKIDPAVAMANIAKQPPSDVTVKPTAEVDFRQLAEYDAKIFGAPRQSFLRKWIAAPQSKSFSAVNSSDQLVGYTVIRKVIGDGEGYRIGPLYANEVGTACSLLKAAAEVAQNSPTPEDGHFYIDVPVEVNPKAVELVNEVSGTPVSSMCRMYTDGVPDIRVENMFGVCTAELG